MYYRRANSRRISSIFSTRCPKNCCFYFPRHILYPGIINRRLLRSLNSLCYISNRILFSLCKEFIDGFHNYNEVKRDFSNKDGGLGGGSQTNFGSFNAFSSEIQSKLNSLKNDTRKLSSCRIDYNYDQKLFGLDRRYYSSNRTMKANTLYSSKTSRALQITDLAISMIKGATVDTIKRVAKGERTSWKESFLSEANMNKLSDSICKMRGAALKLCQFLSMHQSSLPKPLVDALSNARNRADFMPEKQVLNILVSEFGENWRDNFDHFDLTPIASASIGQVHLATVNGRQVAVKIQFPGIINSNLISIEIDNIGVSDSIVSDIDNFIKLCDLLNLVPETMFVDVFGREIKSELLAECHYLNEAEFYRIFKQLLAEFDGFYVPDVYSHLTTNKILTSEFVTGITLDQASMTLSQESRNSIGSRLLKLVMNELFAFQLMNTDPNPRNFVYDPEKDMINLIDFGAVRYYKEQFINDYREIVKASILQDRDRIKELSYSLGFLCDRDTDEMIETHISSVLLIGEPLRSDEYDFRDNEIIENIKKKASKMLNIRSKPPPPEVYTLHRKLAGCYLLCHNLSAKIQTSYCKKILQIN